MCRVMKGVEKMIDEGVLMWFDHVERIQNDRIARSVRRGKPKTWKVVVK